ISRTLVPTFTTPPAPLTFKSLTMVTSSPSSSTFPTASRMPSSAPSNVSESASGDHSCPHIGQTSSAPFSYVYASWHSGHEDNCSAMGFLLNHQTWASDWNIFRGYRLEPSSSVSGAATPRRITLDLPPT